MAVTYTNASLIATRGFLVSANENTQSLTGSTWSSAIELSANSVNAYSRQVPSSAIYEDIAMDFTVAVDGTTIAIQLWWDSGCTKSMMGPSGDNTIKNLGAACSVGGKRLTYPTAPESGLAPRKLYAKLYPSANVTLAIGGLRVNWDSTREA